MQIITTNDRIDQILDQYQHELGNDFTKYRGHCYRILNYLLQLKVETHEIPILEIAIPFHDLGVWTHHTMDYLDVSSDLAKAYITANKLDIDAFLVEEIIVNHHKITPVNHQTLAEKMRKADLIDLSMGIIKCGLSRPIVKQIIQEIPFASFQSIIFKKVAIHALKHIWNPLPMMKI